MTTTLRAFHGDAKIRAKYVRRVRAHERADRIIQGTSWDGDKGCAVGCTLEAYDHAQYPIELGIPEHIAHLEDAIFEGLPAAQARKWPAQFLMAIPVGADLSLVWPRFALWLELDGYATSAPVAALCRRRVAGDDPSVEEWRAAAEA